MGSGAKTLHLSPGVARWFTGGGFLGEMYACFHYWLTWYHTVESKGLVLARSDHHNHISIGKPISLLFGERTLRISLYTVSIWLACVTSNEISKTCCDVSDWLLPYRFLCSARMGRISPHSFSIGNDCFVALDCVWQCKSMRLRNVLLFLGNHKAPENILGGQFNPSL